MAPLVGTAVPRTEDPRLLTGRGRFVDDLQPPGMLHAAFVRSHDAHGRLVSVRSFCLRCGSAPRLPQTMSTQSSAERLVAPSSSIPRSELPSPLTSANR